MSDDNEIIRIPSNIVWMGSCPECGAFIWSTDRTKEGKYKCIKCKHETKKAELIPF